PPGTVFQNELKSARSTHSRDCRWRKAESGSLWQFAELLVQALLDFLILFRSCFAITPWLQSDEKESVVTGPDKTEQAEANNACRVFHAWRTGEDILNLPSRFAGACQRCRIRKLHIDVDIALIFIGQETRRQSAAEKTSRNAQHHQRHYCNGRLADKPSTQADISIRSSSKHAVEPIEKSIEHSSALFLGSKQQSRECRAECKRVERGEQNRNRDGHGELLVEASCDAGDKGCGHEYRRQNQRDTDDWAGELLHCFSSRVLGSKTLLDVALHTLDDDDGIVHHKSHGQDQPEHGKGIDGEAEQRKESKCTHQRDGHGEKWDQRSPPVLKEQIDDKDDQRDGDQKCLNDLLHAFC